MVNEVDNIREEIISIRRQIHMYPEVRFDLDRTYNLVKTKLKEYGVRINENYGKSSLVGIIEGNGDKAIALRADMDALDLHEENDISYKSKIPGKMHGCGHDGHTAMLLGAAKILAQNKERINGRVKLIFQASEEGPYSGAKYMVEDGVVDDVDAIFGIHISTEIPTGKVEINNERNMASSNVFEIELIGRGGHAGSPHKAVDAISMASRLVGEIQYLISRGIDPLEPFVISVGTLNSGHSSNVIPEKATLTGTIRSFSKELTDDVIKRLENITKQITKTSGGNYKFNIIPGLPALINDKEKVKISARACEKIVESKNVLITDLPSMGSEDFAYYAQKVPASFIFLGARNEEKNLMNFIHNPKFNFDEEALVLGSKIFIQHVLDFL
ncbi:M20 metallopeptidase family protein [Maledivibacter halophilus]|uniref:Amidohydrolase n=1 Tax=Maledivibacter halophilus TaxID=36842 RepID=A0A1T5J4L3_9FIRM|nr:amidohydrolase [Maledivibacter halophilus]SKC46138.1 amidohydrolase [Maledivibacter halophilus]